MRKVSNNSSRRMVNSTGDADIDFYNLEHKIFAVWAPLTPTPSMKGMVVASSSERTKMTKRVHIFAACRQGADENEWVSRCVLMACRHEKSLQHHYRGFLKADSFVSA